jgi:hypothetical protein
MTGITGPCTLLYGTQQVTFPTCNSASTVTVNGVGNEKARAALNLANPKWGPSVNGVTVGESIGYSSYNGLLVSLQHRLSGGLSVLSNYTWSHCIDLGGEQGQDIGNSFTNPLNPAGDRGDCGQDRRQLVNISVVALSPKMPNEWMDRLLGHWNTSAIFTAASGSPFNMSDGTDVSLNGQTSVRPNQVADPWTPGPVAANPTCAAPTQLGTEAHWFNNCAFVIQPTGTFGNMGRDTMVGPGTWNLDSAIWRTFRVREKYKLDFRGEGFNVLNHANWGNPATALNTGNPGQITSSTGSARILQVAMKLTF